MKIPRTKKVKKCLLCKNNNLKRIFSLGNLFISNFVNKNNIYKTKSIEITTAVKTTIINNLQINSGDYMAMINGEIVATDNNFNNVLNATLSQIADSELITLYTGDMINSKEREELSNLLNSTFKELDIELYNGGQPLYHILGSVE